MLENFSETSIFTDIKASAALIRTSLQVLNYELLFNNRKTSFRKIKNNCQREGAKQKQLELVEKALRCLACKLAGCKQHQCRIVPAFLLQTVCFPFHFSVPAEEAVTKTHSTCWIILINETNQEFRALHSTERHVTRTLRKGRGSQEWADVGHEYAPRVPGHREIA